jgi:selenium metabolism protein YedF
MTKMIDARGLSCPAPVLLVKDAVDQGNPHELTVLVDNDASRENVTRFLGTQGFTVFDIREGDDYRIEARRAGGAAPVEQTKPAPTVEIAGQKILVLIASDRLGSGEDVLGEKLMINYLKTIREMGPDLWQLVFINGGVKLTTDTSPVLKELQEYEKSGVIILACGTCLEHFGLTAVKKVGQTTNMLDIVTATQLADKVISLG